MSKTFESAQKLIIAKKYFWGTHSEIYSMSDISENFQSIATNNASKESSSLQLHISRSKQDSAANSTLLQSLP